MKMKQRGCRPSSSSLFFYSVCVRVPFGPLQPECTELV